MTVFLTKRTRTNWGLAHDSAWCVTRDGKSVVIQLWRLRLTIGRVVEAKP